VGVGGGEVRPTVATAATVYGGGTLSMDLSIACVGDPSSWPLLGITGPPPPNSCLQRRLSAPTEWADEGRRWGSGPTSCSCPMAEVTATSEGAIGRLLLMEGADLSGSSDHELCLQCLLVLSVLFCRVAHQVWSHDRCSLLV
jgi:hypothetical protein